MIYITAAVILSLGVVFLAACSVFATKPANLGVNEGRLAACPATPNCVSTQAEDERKRIEPIAFTGSPEAAVTAIKQVLSGMPGIRIVSESEDYIHAEATSSIFRFVDDVEFLVDRNSGLIHFRSGSRVGHSDLGANRRRMENFRAIFDDVN